MNDNLKQQLSDRFQQLPPLLKEAIVSGDLPIKIKEIVTKNHLLLDQAAGLEAEIMVVLFGLASPQKLTQALTTELHLSPEQAQSVLADINQNIFYKVREYMIEKSADEETTPIIPVSISRINEAPTPIPKAPVHTVVNTPFSTQTPIEIKDAEENLNKAEVLSQIENPINNSRPQGEALPPLVRPNSDTQTSPLVTRPLRPLNSNVYNNQNPTALATAQNPTVPVEEVSSLKQANQLELTQNSSAPILPTVVPSPEKPAPIPASYSLPNKPVTESAKVLGSLDFLNQKLTTPTQTTIKKTETRTGEGGESRVDPYREPLE